MKRRDLIRHLSQHGCIFVREGGEHSIWENPANNHRTSVPRHREIPEFTALRICKQLDIPPPLSGSLMALLNNGMIEADAVKQRRGDTVIIEQCKFQNHPAIMQRRLI